MLDPNKEYVFGDQQVTTLDPDKEYDFGSSQDLYREAPPTFTETASIVGLEILGPVIGSFFGPKGTIAGSAIGNYLSQKYRIAKGLQDDIGLGELGLSNCVRCCSLW